MQTFKILAALMTVAALGTGCSMNQDPYANQPDEVKNAGPMDQAPKEKHSDALSSAYLRIQAEDSYEFREGQETKLTIKGAVLADANGHTPVLGQDYQLTIDNMTDFPGATFDANTGEFKWTPKAGYVDTEYTKNVHIQVTLATLFKPILQTQKNIIGIITRTGIDPTVESIDDLTNPATKEGDTRDFRVWVRDPHASDKSADTKPRLAIVADGYGSTSAANLIYCVSSNCTNPDKDPNDPQRYSFKMRLDLTGKEITKADTATLTFGVMAISRFGETSPVKRANVVVRSKIQNPEISWSVNDPIEVVAGRQNLINFTVYDPNSEGQLTVNFDTACNLTLGPTATCSCSNLARVGTSAQLCKIVWDVPPSPLQTDYTIRFTTFNRSKDQSQYTSLPYERTLHVIQAAPAPAPGPAPAPAPAPAPGPGPGPAPAPTPTPTPGPIHTTPSTLFRGAK
jgi:hypothetical protein